MGSVHRRSCSSLLSTCFSFSSHADGHVVVSSWSLTVWGLLLVGRVAVTGGEGELDQAAAVLVCAEPGFPRLLQRIREGSPQTRHAGPHQPLLRHLARQAEIQRDRWGCRCTEPQNEAHVCHRSPAPHLSRDRFDLCNDAVQQSTSFRTTRGIVLVL